MYEINARDWKRYFVRRTQRTRTTWTLRLAVVALLIAATWLTRAWWETAIARGLVCAANAAPSDAILVENFDPDYLVFERAGDLRRAGIAPRVLVPVPTDQKTSRPDGVVLAISDVIAKLARTGTNEIVPVRQVEPISLNAARDVGRFLQREGIRSVVVVSPLFRSRRSALVYGAALGDAGITVTCEPVEETHGVRTWTATWHGVADVTEQLVKLLYYKIYVLPFKTSRF